MRHLKTYRARDVNATPTPWADLTEWRDQLAPACDFLFTTTPPMTDSTEEVAEVIGRFWWYLDGDTTAEDVYAQGQTRHQVEFALAVALRDAGCSPEQVLDMFDRFEPLKHAEKKRENPGNPYGWAKLTIGQAFKTPRREPRTSRSRRKRKRAWNSPDRYQVLVMISEREEAGDPFIVGELVSAIVDRWECDPRTGENMISQLIKAKELRRQKQGRTRLVFTTDKAKRLLTQTTPYQTGIHFLPPVNPTQGKIKRPRTQSIGHPSP